MCVLLFVNGDDQLNVDVYIPCFNGLKFGMNNDEQRYNSQETFMKPERAERLHNPC